MNKKAFLNKTKPGKGKTILVYTLLISGLFVVLTPFYWMIISSFKPEMDIWEYPIRWIPKRITIENYLQIFNEFKFGLYYFNSLKITAISVFFEVITGVMAGYGFACLKWKGRDKIFTIYISTLVVPWMTIILGQYKLLSTLGLTNSHAGLILIHATSIFGTFMIRQFMLQVPKEMLESARIDGLNEFQIAFRIVLPLIQSGLVAMVILRTIACWNDFFGALIFLTSKALHTIPRALSDFQFDAFNQTPRYGLVLAGVTVSILPIVMLYFIAQKRIVEGIAHSGTKG